MNKVALSFVGAMLAFASGAQAADLPLKAQAFTPASNPLSAEFSAYVGFDAMNHTYLQQ